MKKEYRTILSLALLMVLRMLGLFMILPVFSMHAGEFTHTTPQLIGLALGIYGLTQALLQIPLGMLSDRIGRKPVMAMGLGIFIIGSIWAALAHTIYGLIIGRALQGGGAIGSTILATVADLTPEAKRSKAMGIIGLAVGLAFGIAMIVGPLLNMWAGLSGIFWVTAALALIGELLVWYVIPSPPRLPTERQALKTGLIRSLQNPDLMRLNAGIFSLHAILTALFIAIPVILTQVIHLSSSAQTLLYLAVLSLSFILMLPFIILAEKKKRPTVPAQAKSSSLPDGGSQGGEERSDLPLHSEQSALPMRRIETRKLFPLYSAEMRAAIFCLLLAQLGLLPLHQHLLMLGVLLLLFFTAFSLLEAVLPSWVSKVCPPELKGAAMGCYSSAQFLGIFAGGSIGGWVYGHFGINAIFLLGAAIALAWLLLLYSQEFSSQRESRHTVLHE